MRLVRWWRRLCAKIALGLIGLVGCGASMNVMQKPQGPGSVPKGQPYMMLVVSGVDLAAQGLYLAPNVVPALQPDFNAKAPPPPPAPAPPTVAQEPPAAATPAATPTAIDKALQSLWNTATGGNQ